MHLILLPVPKLFKLSNLTETFIIPLLLRYTMSHIAYDAAVLLAISATDRYTDDMGIVFFFEELNLGNAERDRLWNDGIQSVGELVDQYGYDIKSFQTYLQNLNKTFATAANPADRVYLSPPVIKQLCGALFYFNHCVNTLHIIPDILVTDGTFLMENYEQFQMLSGENDDDEEDDNIDIPTLKGHENWVQWRDAFIASLSNSYGSRGIPYDYLVDETERDVTRANAAYIEYDAVNLEDEGLFKTMAVHFGPTFKSDNAKLWKKLKTLLINTPPYNHISDFNNSKNGRGAWQSLLTAYQGSDFMERMRDSAFDSLKKAHYRGECKSFGWEKYVQIHKEAHKKLVDAGYNNGKGMDEETKVQHLKSNIRAEAGLESALTISRSNNQHRYDFDLFVSFISAEVNNKTDRLKQLEKTNVRVASVTQGRRGGRGHHRHGGRGNPGRGNDRVPDSVRWKNFPSRIVDGMTVYGVKYPSARFSKMNNKQRQAVIDLRRQYWNEKDGRSNNNTNIVSAAMTAVQEDMIVLEDRIISAVTRASNENADDQSQLTGNTTTNDNKRKASSGSIGAFLASQNKRGKKQG